MEKESYEVKRHTIFNHLKFIFDLIWNYDKRIVFFQYLEIVMQTLAGFGLLLLPALMIHFLTAKYEIGQLIVSVITCFLIFGMIEACSTYLFRRNTMQYIKFRGGYCLLLFLQRVLGMDYEKFENEKVQRVIENASDLGLGGNNYGLEGMLHAFTKLMIGILSLILYVFFLSNVNIMIVLFLLAISLLQFIAFTYASRYEFSNTQKKGEYAVSQGYFERQAYNVRAGKDIRLYQLQDWLTKEYQSINQKYQKLVEKERLYYFSNDLLGLILQLVRDGVSYFYFMHLLRQGLELSSFVLYIGLIASFSQYFNQITEQLMAMQKNKIGVEYVRELFAIAKTNHTEGKIEQSKKELTYDIEFCDVSFSYPGKEDGLQKKVLDHLSFHIRKGEKIALVGVNGAGKSTIVKLICGFYKPTEGTIKINGIDILNWNLDAYYKDLAVLFQESFSTAFTIEENVTCQEGKEERDLKCLQALSDAGLMEKIDSLDKKEKTHLDKDVAADGIKLSGGQMQKLMLARALYKNCKVLLLDEPTAALDAIAENEMYETYHRLLEGKTSLFISHRLASTRFCNRIIFLENGTIKEEGSHEELMKKNGKYKEMFEVQSKYYKEESENEFQDAI